MSRTDTTAKSQTTNREAKDALCDLVRKYILWQPMNEEDLEKVEVIRKVLEKT